MEPSQSETEFRATMMQKKEAAGKTLTVHFLLSWVARRIVHKVFMDTATPLNLQTGLTRAAWHRCTMRVSRSSERGCGKGTLPQTPSRCISFFQHSSSTVEISSQRQKAHGISPQISLMRRLEVSLLQSQCCSVGEGF